MGSDTLPEERLKKYFDAFWPSLFEVINQVNSEIKFLPVALRERLMKILPLCFGNVRQIEI
jgi:cephalosporin-C deacetylase-like acetyl esterase